MRTWQAASLDEMQIRQRIRSIWGSVRCQQKTCSRSQKLHEQRLRYEVVHVWLAKSKSKRTKADISCTYYQIIGLAVSILLVRIYPVSFNLLDAANRSWLSFGIKNWCCMCGLPFDQLFKLIRQMLRENFGFNTPRLFVGEKNHRKTFTNPFLLAYNVYEVIFVCFIRLLC